MPPKLNVLLVSVTSVIALMLGYLFHNALDSASTAAISYVIAFALVLFGAHVWQGLINSKWWNNTTPKLILFALIVGISAMLIGGCTATVTAGQAQPPLTPSQQFVDSLAITAVKVGITGYLSPKIEDSYAAGKIPKPEYLAMRDEEVAALNALNGLQAKVAANLPVTQDELSSAEASFVTPLFTLAAPYIGSTTLPTTQP